MVSREDELWAATRVAAMHQHGGRCGMCTRDGCRMRVWAETIRAQAARDGYDLPPVEPVWSPTEPPAGGSAQAPICGPRRPVRPSTGGR
jgi:hypothetical protein